MLDIRKYPVILTASASPAIALIFYVMKNQTPLQWYLLSILLLFIVLLIGLGTALMHTTNESSISGMVAQRYHKPSYFTILLITGVSFFTSCFILAGAIARERAGNANAAWAVVLGSLSPIVSSLMLLAPIQVTKTAGELRMIPNTQPSDGKFELKFYKCLKKEHHQFLHYAAIISGLLMGYASIVSNIINEPLSLAPQIVVSVCTLISALAMIIFLCANNCKGADKNKRAAFLCEFIGLFYYMCSLIISNAITGDLIDTANL